jgi:hypothetical protein
MEHVNSKDILVVYSELSSPGARQSYRSDESRLEQKAGNSLHFSTEKIKQSIFSFTNIMSEILSSIKKNDGEFNIEEVQIHAAMDMEAGIQIIGAKFGGGFEGGLRFVWKRCNLTTKQKTS